MTNQSEVAKAFLKKEEILKRLKNKIEKKK
jgi:hypothetical protein